MPKPFDAVTKHLIDLHPGDWLALIGITGTGAEALDVALLDTDLSTVTSQADRVLRLSSPGPSLLHIELETGRHGADSPENLLFYSTLVSRKYKLAVESTIVLLRPEADSPALTGTLRHHRRNGEAYLTFEYNVVRVWELSAERLLTSGIGTLPLAPLADLAQEELPDVLRRMRQRLDSEAPTAAEEGEFWTATTILMGLRYSEARRLSF